MFEKTGKLHRIKILMRFEFDPFATAVFAIVLSLAFHDGSKDMIGWLEEDVDVVTLLMRMNYEYVKIMLMYFCRH